MGRRITPLGRRRQHEQFARAVDAQPDEAARAAQAGDAGLADELAVVALLRKAAATSGPDEATRARMRARVLGASPSSTDAPGTTPAATGPAGAGPATTTATSPTATSPTATSPARLTAVGPRASRPAPPGTAPSGTGPAQPTTIGTRRPRGGARGRLAIALAAALCLVFSLAGMSLLLSRDALPGDALYGVKRTAESASLGLTFGEESKGYKRLEFAAARVAEMETLADRYRDSGGGPLGGYLTALTDFDADAAAGSRVLAAHGSNSDQRTLSGLRDWALSQTTRLGDLRGRLPAEASARAGTSLELLDRIAKRAADLSARTACATVTSGQTDDVGPVPATGECTPPSTAPSPSPTDPPSVLGSTPGGGSTTPGDPTAPPAATPGTPGTQNPPLPLPSVTTTVTPPVQLPTLSLPLLPLPGLTG
ncbi:DUF5667 domain-containing protein [Saccharothrix variisporea]|uniref:DUF5667 domain-containing protein n=1 Tax=Saccharothrix variisporea TaxID=543527 RepID=UPI001B870B67|nr:DUF5667 domain-containing protein [Saccharothrix variisporea]